MKRKLTAFLAGVLILSNIPVYAEDYWTEVNTDIETGIGSEGSGGEVKLGSIETYIQNGWSSEFAETGGTATDYVSPYQEEIDLVVRLGIMSAITSAETTDFFPQEKLTYYDYAETLKNLTKYSSIDVSALQGVENIVTCGTVIKDMITLLGYNYFAEVNGTSFAALADEYGITEGISLNDTAAITREQFAKVLANTLETDMLTVKISDVVAYEVVEGNTLLSAMDVEEIKGWVNAAEDINMYGLGKVADGKVQIDAIEYLAGMSGAENYLGRYVTAYVQGEDDDEKTIVKIDVNEKKDNFLVVLDNNIESVTKDRIEYYETDSEGKQIGKSKTEKLSQNGNVIYNGKFAGTVASVNESLLTPKNGEIKLADTDFDGTYDVIFVWDYVTYVVEQVSGTRVFLMDNKGILDLDDEKKNIKLTIDDIKSNVDELSKWNVLSVAKTLDEDMYTVKASSKNVSGVYITNDEDYVVLEDGTKFIKDKSFFGDLELRGEYKLYLTHMKKVITVEEASTDKATNTGTGRNYVYFRKAYFDDENEEGASFRIFKLSSGEWATVKGAEKIKIYNGVVTNESDEEVVKPLQKLTARETAEFLTKPQLLVVETNIYGEISEITIALDYTATGELNDDVFAYNHTRTDRLRTYYGGYMGGLYHAGKYIRLRVPEDREQEKYYAIEPNGSDGNIPGPMDIYDVSESLAANGVIIRYTASGSGTGLSETRGNTRIIIEKIETVEILEETAYKVTALGGKEYFITDTDDIGRESIVKVDSKALWHVTNAAYLKKGDVMCADVDDLGYITAFRVDVRLSEITDKAHFAYTTGDDPPAMTYDYGVVMNNPSTTTNVVLNASGNILDKTKNKAKVVSGLMYAYDTKTGKFEQITKADILPGDTLLTRALYYYNDVAAILIK